MMQFIDGRRGKPDALPTHPTKRWGKRPVSAIRGLVVHHTAGSNDDPHVTAAYHVGASHTSADGMAGLAYTFYIRDNGDVWWANDLDDRTWSHGGGKIHPDVNGDGKVDKADGLGNANAEFMGVVVAGSFDSRWNKTGSQPTAEQIASLLALWSHLVGFAELSSRALPIANLFGALDHLSLGDIWGHADFGKAACPGDRLLDLTTWLRGDGETWRNVKDWQWELFTNGYPPGTSGPARDGVDGQWGPKSAAALRAFQAANGLEPTGNRDAVTARALFA